MSLGWLVSGAYHPAHRKKLNILAVQISGTPTNIPVALVIASDADLAADARSDAHDIAITKADGITELDYERVSWSSGTGALLVWFKAPDPESGDAYYLYYGDADQVADRQNATGVWSNSYEAVWHLNQQLLDSSGNTGTLFNSGCSGVPTGGKIAGYYEVVGAEEDYLQVEGGAVYDYPFTLECWFRPTDVTSAQRLVFVGDKDVTNYYCALNARGDDIGDPVSAFNQRYAGGASGTAESTAGFVANVWQYAVGTFSSTTARAAFLDGGNKGTNNTETGTIANHDRTSVGALRDSSPSYSGTVRIEAVRISSVIRSDNWVITCFNNQNSVAPGGTFWSALGSEEKESRHPAVVFQCPAIV